jgi:hypothetical protein
MVCTYNPGRGRWRDQGARSNPVFLLPSVEELNSESLIEPKKCRVKLSESLPYLIFLNF